MNAFPNPVRRGRWLLMALAAVVLAAIQTTTSLPSVAQTLPAARWDHKPDGRTWTQMLLDSIGQHGMGMVNTVPVDIVNYCPAYPTADQSKRTAFWVGLLSALAKPESNFNPAKSYRENFKDSQGNWVISRGLLQLSIESGRGYGCVIPKAEALHEPVVNLACGVRIMNRWIVEDGRINNSASPWHGAARYWSPFRNPVLRREMQNWTKQQAYCRP